MVHCWLLMGKAYYYNKEYQEANQVFSYIREHFRDKEKIMHESYVWEVKSYLASGDTLQALFLSEAIDIQQLSRKSRKEFSTCMASLKGFIQKPALTGGKYYLPGTYRQQNKIASFTTRIPQGFTTDAPCTRLLFIYPDGIQSNEQRLYSLLSFNFTYLYVKILEVEIRNIETLQVGVISGFTGPEEMEQYLSLFYSYTPLDMHPLSGIVPVSDMNYQLIRNTTDFHNYIIFYLSEEICKLPGKHKLYTWP